MRLENLHDGLCPRCAKPLDRADVRPVVSVTITRAAGASSQDSLEFRCHHCGTAGTADLKGGTYSELTLFVGPGAPKCNCTFCLGPASLRAYGARA